MGIIGAYAVPHPPLIVPAVGKGAEDVIAATVAAYRKVARDIAAARPDAIVLLSSHAPAYRDGFYVSKGGTAVASMANFNAPQERFEVDYDVQLAAAVCDAAEHAGISTCGYDPNGNELDHASFIPLWFVRAALADMLPPIVRIGLSWLPFTTHRTFGHALARAIETSGKRVALVASGDLSHRLLAEGPYGFRKEGPEFDGIITNIFARGALDELFDIDAQLAEGAGECGLRPFMILAGALEEQAANAEEREDAQLHLEAQLLSYEGPFGVGYAVASFTPRTTACPTEPDRADETGCAEAGKPGQSSRAGDGGDGEDAQRTRPTACLAEPDDVDPFVALARASVEHFVRTGTPLARPDGLPDELLSQRAGAFVSLHSHGDLRGCIGTISACTQCLADEIIANGVSAASCDPRFPAVRPDELDDIEYSVDVLGKAEPIASTSELDPVRYGVIVTKGRRRGLLLPNLDGVDTVERQVAIARAKAGIGDWEQGVKLERFEVVRHTAGGEARNGR